MINTFQMLKIGIMHHKQNSLNLKICTNPMYISFMIEENMMDNLINKVKDMEEVLWFFVMDLNIMENFKMIKDMDKEN